MLLCQRVSYDTGNPSAPYSLHGVVTQLVPEPGNSFPLLLPELCVFFQASGDPGDYQVWVDLVPLDGDGEATGEETSWGPWILLVRDGAYVESRTCPLQNLPFAASGMYEVRLWCGHDLLAREELLVWEA